MKYHFLIMFSALFLLCVAAVQPTVAQVPAANPIRVLVIDDLSQGYYHMFTATTLRNIIRKDERFHVTLVEDAEVLGTDLPFDYDVVLLHFKNYREPKRNAAMKASLEKFVTEGGGLFVYHFACGAFEDWQGFEKFSGRVWDPALPAHDPYGRFAVNIVDKEHPITKGVGNFEIDDELYTCLKTSDVPIRVLAEATSKVDGKKYPMAFVLENGKGRTFHTTLGHDDRSLSCQEFQAMIKNALVWCANPQPSVPTKAEIDARTSQTLSRLKEITDALPNRVRLLSYIDCGSGSSTVLEYEGSPELKITPPESAKPWQFRPDKPLEGVPPSHLTVLYDTAQLSFLIEGLDRSKKYQLNVVWWDFDGNGRSQSLVVQSPDLSMVRILRAGIALPDFKVSGLPPKTITAVLPMAFVRDGKLILNVNNEGGPNAVVSEIWINEMP